MNLKNRNFLSRCREKKVLFIASESYDAPTITVIEGLHKLGFTIYTLHKANINAWFCNQIISNVSDVKFDFVLSNLHWGTRWSYYNQYNLWNYPKVLIDGDDNKRGCMSWHDKYDLYWSRYQNNPPEDIKLQQLSPYRWMEPLGNYDPDVVFTAQKEYGDNDTFYLPFGITDQYLDIYVNHPISERPIDYLHVPGPGIRRLKMQKWLHRLKKLRLLPGRLVNRPLRGIKKVASQLKQLEANDNNIHSYHRWADYADYVETLGRSKILIYPGIHNSSQWDSKRPWEGYAAGCLVMMLKPTINVSEYPITDICPFAVCGSMAELISKCIYLQRKPDVLEKHRINSYETAVKHFNSQSIASYFLKRVYETIS